MGELQIYRRTTRASLLHTSYATEDSDFIVDQFLPHDFLMLSLSLSFSEDSVIDAEAISYSLTPQLSSEVSENPSEHTLSLFPEVSGNLVTSRPIGNNTPPPPPSSSGALPSTDLCLSLPSAPSSSSTTTTLQFSNGSQNSSDIASSSREVNALGNCAPNRSVFQELGEEKIKLRKESNNNPKQQRLIIRQAAAGEEGPWITKKLTSSDVNGASRLLLPRQEVNNNILPFMDEEQQTIISQQLQGIDVTVFDMDTQTEHALTFKKWSTDSFHLVKAWVKEFVKRRNLKENDVISIRWEKHNSRFCFRVQNRNQIDGV